MKKYFILFVLIISFSNTAFAAKYLGIGGGPNFGVMNTKTSNLMFNMEWLAHNNVGTKLFIGFMHGFWIGTGLSINVSTDPEYKDPWYVTASFALPIMVNICDNYKDIMMGFMVGSTYSFSLHSQRKYYMFIKPFEAFLVPATWRMAPGASTFSNSLRIYLSAQIGFRMNI